VPSKLSSVSILPVALVLALACSLPRLTPVSLELQTAVNNAISGRDGAIVVVSVTSQSVLASHNLALASGQLVRPGSTLKPFVLLELLESGKLDARQHLLCRRPLYVGDARMDCSHTSDVVELDADDAIAYSCNSYVAEVASRLDHRELLEALRRAGLDSATGLAEGEAVGYMDRLINPDQVQLAALGERGVNVTPLELLEAYRKLALRRRTGTKSLSRAVLDGLEHAITYGTAHAAYVEGMKIAGKTGTATAPNTTRTHGLFVGYAPADHPEIAIVVYIPQGRGLDAANLAQPVFAEYAKLTNKR
jgi:cell division protein FtsI/penicillin-binding protein 2